MNAAKTSSQMTSADARAAQVCLLFACLLPLALLAPGCADDDEPVPPDTRAPAAVSDLAIDSTGATGIRLSWTAPGDDSLSGKAAAYDLRYAHEPFESADWEDLSSVAGEPQPSPAGQQQSFVVPSLLQRTPYFFALKTADEANNSSAMSNVVGDTTTTTTWTVAPDGSGNFTTIAEAIAAVADGDTILIASGTYTDPLAITDRRLTLIGAGPDATLIRHGAALDEQDPALSIRRSTLTVQSLRITQDNIDCFTAIDAESSQVVIEDCALIHCGIRSIYGDLELRGCTLWGLPAYLCDTIIRLLTIVGGTAQIEQNILTNNPYGVLCADSPQVTFVCNDVWCTQENYADCFDPSGGQNISENPRFIDPENDDFHLRPTSPCVAGASQNCGQMGAFGI